MIYTKHISYKTFIQALYRAQTPKYMPGLYARYNPSQEKVHYLYYCPIISNKTFTTTPCSIFTHCRNTTTAIRFNMIGSIAASNYSPIETVHNDKQATISNNFAALNQVINDLQLETLACEIYIQPSITTNHQELSNYLHNSISIREIKDLLSQHRLTTIKQRTNYVTPWKNYTWVAILKPANAKAYSAYSILNDSSSHQEPLQSAIPVIHNSHALRGYTNLFYASKQAGNNVYRGLDILCSDYVRWILTDDNFRDEKLSIQIKNEDDHKKIIPIVAKREPSEKYTSDKPPLVYQHSLFYLKSPSRQEKQHYSI